MKAIPFEDANLTLAKNQPQYNQLPVCYEGPGEGKMTSCFKLSLKERLKLLFTGKIFFTQLTFNKGFHPISPTLDWKKPYCSNCNMPTAMHK